MTVDSEWFRDWFGADYLTVYEHRDKHDAWMQVKLIQKICRISEGTNLLDLCCGDGRHSRMFHELGCTVTGVDLSEHLIERARKHSDDGITYNVEDMRKLDFKEEFDLCVNLFTSFGYFREEKEHAEVICRVHKALKPDGILWLDFLNRDKVRRIDEPRTVRDINEKTSIEEKRWLDKDEKRINKSIRIRIGEEVREYFESVRLFSGEELKGIFTGCGFSVIHEFGDYEGGPITSDSPRCIIVGRK